jgi:purine-nucleoside phosphorylase
MGGTRRIPVSIHIGASEGQIADVVLLPGDPLRAEHIAQTFFEGAERHSNVRGMLGFTGTYRGRRVSVQGTGMGVPSLSIYVHELIENYGARTLIRVGTCGAYQPHVRVRDLVLAMSASTDSNVNRIRFRTFDYAPTADFELLHRAYEMAKVRGFAVHVGNVFTSDTFYTEDDATAKRLAAYGTLAVEMETAALYTIAARFGARALSVLTVSDHIVTGEATSAQERQTTFNEMVEVALESAL